VSAEPVEAEHALVVGPSGGGKTTYLRTLHARHNGPSVFLTPDPDEQRADHSPPWRSRREGARYPADIERAREWARRTDGFAQVIVDEVQEAPTFIEGDGPVRDGLHRDRSDGVKWVIATQSPSDLRTDANNYAPLQQADLWVFVGPAKTWHIGFFRSNGMGDIVDHLPTSNHEYVVLKPLASLEGAERVVYRGETDPRYG